MLSPHTLSEFTHARTAALETEKARVTELNLPMLLLEGSFSKIFSAVPDAKGTML